MKTEVDKLRELYQAYAASKKPRSRRGCPSPSAIARSFESSTPAREKKRIVDHISDCSFCREEFMMMLELQKHEAATIQVKSPAESYEPRRGVTGVRRSGHPFVWQYATALFGLSLVICSLFFLNHQRDLSRIQRTGGSGIGLLYPMPGQSISGPLVFRWRERPGSEFYVLELFDAALLPIWTSDKIQDSQILIPADIRSKLLQGKSYFWMVTAFSHDSRTVESSLARFQFLR